MKYVLYVVNFAETYSNFLSLTSFYFHNKIQKFIPKFVESLIRYTQRETGINFKIKYRTKL